MKLVVGEARHADHLQLMKKETPAYVGTHMIRLNQKEGESLGHIGLESIDKMGVSLLNTVYLVNPAQHQLGQGILI